jgi:hypothetical protein
MAVTKLLRGQLRWSKVVLQDANYCERDVEMTKLSIAWKSVVCCGGS